MEHKDLSLSIGVLCYNEEAHLEDAVNDVLSALQNTPIDYEIVIINDGSLDRTGQIADALAARHEPVRVIHFDHNRGVAQAYCTAFRSARKKYWTYIPGDNQFIFSTVLNFLPYLGGYDVVTGYIENKQTRTLLRRAASLAFNKFVNTIFNVRIDYTNGLNIFRTDLIQDMELEATGHSIQCELILKLIKLKQVKYRIVPFRLREGEGHKTTALNCRSVCNAFYFTLKLWKELTFRKKRG